MSTKDSIFLGRKQELPKVCFGTGAEIEVRRRFPIQKGSLLKAADTSTVTLFCRAMTHQSGIKNQSLPRKEERTDGVPRETLRHGDFQGLML